MITAVVTSDNHLGTYYARLRPDRLERRRRALQQAFERVVDTTVALGADLFLHAGDLFDRPDPRNAERRFVARQVRRLRDAGVAVFAIAGNHDSPRSLGYDGGTLPHEEIEALGAIHLFRDTGALQPQTELIGGRRVCVWGMSSDMGRDQDACPLQDGAACHERGGDLDIVLLHYGVEGWAQPFAREPFLSRTNLDRLGADVICVGHLHARNETRLPGGALLLNPGATEHIHFGEERLSCGFFVLRFEPGHVQAEYVPLPTQPMRTLALDLTQEAPESLMPNLLAQIEAASQEDQLLRVLLQGRLSRPHFQALDLNTLLTRGGTKNFSCQIDTQNLMIRDEFADLPLGYGVSFDIGQELQNITDAFAASCADDPGEREICRLSGQELASAFERLTGGAR